MTKPAVIDELTARDAKVLRFVVARSKTEPVAPAMCCNEISWSDLPKTDMQARKTLGRLLRHGLVERLDKNAYSGTDAGRAVVKYIDAEGLWRTPPPREVTNVSQRKGNQ